MEHPSVTIIPVLSDNYTYLIHDQDVGLIVDPGEAEPVEKVVKELDIDIEAILLTHHHDDHVRAAKALSHEYECPVMGPADTRLGDIDDKVLTNNRVVQVQNWAIEVIPTPGHTSSHVALYLPDIAALFSGDCLFGCGAGFAFEGTAEQMAESLLRLRELPDETQVYFGHEYTERNIRFALHLDPDNSALQRRAKEVKALRANNQPTPPCTIGVEKETNPFFQLDQPKMIKKLQLPAESTPGEVFATLDAKKKEFNA